MLLPTCPQCAHQGRGRQKTLYYPPSLAYAQVPQLSVTHSNCCSFVRSFPHSVPVLCLVSMILHPSVQHLTPTAQPLVPRVPTTPQLRSESLAGLCHPAAALPGPPGSFSRRVARKQFKNSASVSAFWCHLKTIGSLQALRTVQPLQPACSPLCSAICGFVYMCAQRYK